MHKNLTDSQLMFREDVRMILVAQLLVYDENMNPKIFA